jgi:CHAD domain-containing protein
MLTHPLLMDLTFSLAGSDDARATLDRLLQPARGRSETLSITHFDTPDLALGRAGMTLGVRRDGRRFVQMLAREGGGTAPLARWRNETVIAGPMPELARLPVYPRRLAAALRHGVAPVFTIAASRRNWDLGGDAMLALVLTEGSIVTDGAAQPFRHAEIRFADGALDAAIALGRRLSQALPLDLTASSPALHGYARRAPGLSRQAENGEPTLWSGMSVHAAFRLIAQDCLRRFLGEAARFRESRTADSVHRMRVAMRRFRTLMRFHRAVLAPEEEQFLRRHVARVFARLGEARAWDIVLAHADMVAGSDHSALAPVEAARMTAYARVARLLASPGLRQGLLALLGWLARFGRAGDAAGDRPLAAHAARLLSRQRKRLRAYGDIARFDAATLHEVRIETKRMRYACEFYGSLFPLERARLRRYLAGLSEVQLVLGRFNDLITVQEIAATFGQQHVRHKRKNRVAAANLARKLRRDGAEALRRSLKAKRFW